MAKNRIELRRQRYFKLGSLIAQMDNAQLRSLFEASESRAGWGRNHTIDLGSSKVFVKRVPVTDAEHDNFFSTKNLYRLPTYYNYGVSSAGFGVFRELVAHIKTTNWVLDGQIETFPLMYHHRLIPFSGKRAEVDHERHKSYVEYWGGDENIARYRLDRASANHELVLFLEYVPHVLRSWLPENPGRVHAVLDDLCATIDFLRKNEVIHFDAHFGNILTDGERTYLTDFGLVLDKTYILAEDEKAFFKANTYYDYGEVLSCLDTVLYRAYEVLPETDKCRLKGKCGIEEHAQDHELMPVILDNIEESDVAGMMKLDKSYVTCVVRYRSIIALMRDFYSRLRRNNKKDTKLPHAKLRRLLKEAGVLSGHRS
jgi:serine/threonine protein kinase